MTSSRLGAGSGVGLGTASESTGPSGVLRGEHVFAYCGDVHVRGSFDGPATPLSEATFVVVDLETTGTSAELCDITEVGALKLRGGERVSTLHTWVGNGGDDDTCLESVMPALLEFVGGAVLVGH